MARVMIVDDSPTEVHVLQTMLTKNGHEVIVATSGEEGVEMAKTEMPDLVLMDVVMPGMKGFKRHGSYPKIRKLQLFLSSW